MVSTKARAVTGPTPLCFISSTASGRRSASVFTAPSSSSIRGLRPSSSSSNSFRRWLAQGPKLSPSSSARPRALHQLLLPAHALAHGQEVQLVPHRGLHPHQLVAVLQQLPHVALLRRRHPDAR